MRFSLVLFAPLIFLATDGLSSQTGEFVSTDCGISFLHPAAWRVAKSEEQKCLFLITSGTAEPPDGQISVEVVPEGFAAAAAEAGFEYRYGRWEIRDASFMWMSTEPVSNPLLWGIRAAPVERCYGDDGYRGMCDTHMAVASNFDGRVVTIRGGPATGEEFDLLLESLRFDLEFTLDRDPTILSEAIQMLGAPRLIRGLKAPRKELWDRLLRQIRHGAYAVEIAAALVDGADAESRAELARSVQDAFVEGSSWVHRHVGNAFTVAEVCRPPAALQGAERAAWIAKAETNLTRWSSDLTPDRVERCRVEMRSP